MDEPRSELTKALVRAGLRGKVAGTTALQGMGAGRPEGGQSVPLTAQRVGGNSAPMGMGKARDESPQPSCLGKGNFLEAGERQEFAGSNDTHMDAAMAAAMSNGMQWRVVRAMPLLMIANAGLHD